VKALAELQIGQKIEATPEVKELITECQYRRNLAQGKLLLNEKKPTEALGFLKIAQRFRDTVEVQALIKVAEDIIKKAQKMESGGP
jgi:hypothetical protein